MNNKDFKWTEKRFGLTFANILKKLTGLSKDSTDGSIEYKDEQGNVSKLVTDSTFSSLLAKNGLIEVKWQELKDKRDNGQLIPGSLYRITDYNCTTTQENTRSAGHQFDIVLLALSENKLAEEGWAMMHDNIYDVTFVDGVTKKCYVYENPMDVGFYYLVDVNTLLGIDGTLEPNVDIQINEENKTATVIVFNSNQLTVENVPYNYFQNSNLSAWKVWYCLDNDTARFAWADDKIRLKINVNGDVYITTGRISVSDIGEYLDWGQQYKDGGPAVYSKGTPKIGDSVYTWTGSPSSPIWVTLGIVEEIEITNGRGVIYRLIDEFNNDVAYDFKNIQFVRKLTDGAYDTNGNNTWVYTFNVWYNNASEDASVIGNTLVDDTPMVCGVAFNKINEVRPIQGSTQKLQVCLNDVVFLTTEESGLYVGTTYNNCLNSHNCTITLCQNVDIEDSVNLNIEGCDVSKFYSCFGDYDSWSYCFFINNKKVLTEE